jgi:hypothetical protein
MKLNKGFLFSLFVITALALIVIIFKVQNEFKEEDRAEVFKIRVEKTNMFVEDIERDIERSLYVTSFRAFLGMEEYMYSNTEFIDNINLRIPELILNGTINGIKMNSTNSSTFLDWLQKIQILGQRFLINVSFNNITINISQSDPWTVQIDFFSNISIADYDSVITWNFSIEKSTKIDIREAHFADPVYYVKGLNNYMSNKGVPPDNQLLNNIEQNLNTEFWRNDSFYINVTVLREFTINQLYNQSATGPSYLMRLQGITNCTQPYTLECRKNGIESFVNVLNTGMGNKIFYFSYIGDKTCAVDYQFFAEGCSEMHEIANMGGNFLLDTEHLIKYNLTAINMT